MIFVGEMAFCQDTLFKKIPDFIFKVEKTNNLFFLDNQKSEQKSSPVLSANFYVTQLGFFCRQEIKLEKITKIPFRFRLGSVSECDWLEGKMKRN